MNTTKMKLFSRSILKKHKFSFNAYKGKGQKDVYAFEEIEFLDGYGTTNRIDTKIMRDGRRIAIGDATGMYFNIEHKQDLTEFVPTEECFTEENIKEYNKIMKEFKFYKRIIK